jgi:hypothetical protein
LNDMRLPNAPTLPATRNKTKPAKNHYASANSIPTNPIIHQSAAPIAQATFTFTF